MNAGIRAELMTLQDGRCGVCGTDRSSLELDHDHHSGMIRGLLCRTCNRAEGNHLNSCSLDTCPICRWRAQPAVAWLGWTEVYRNTRGAPAVIGPWTNTTRLIRINRAVDRRAVERFAALLDAPNEEAS